jgi:hypothetical protein
MITFIVMPGNNGCVNSCVNSPEDGPVGPKHVEICQYINYNLNSDICWFFISYVERMHITKSLKNGIIICPTQLHLIGCFYKICIMVHGPIKFKIMFPCSSIT